MVAGSYLSEHRDLREASLAAAAETRTDVLVAEEFRQLIEANDRADQASRETSRDATRTTLAGSGGGISRGAAVATRQNPPVSGPPVSIPGSCSEYSGNRATGCALLLEAGFGLDQMPCLDSLWTKESGWNHLAQNTSSGAYGIPQSLPGSKMASAGADWQTNPATQIRWGLGYIQGRYNTPCGAYQYSQTHGFY